MDALGLRAGAGARHQRKETPAAAAAVCCSSPHGRWGSPQRAGRQAKVCQAGRLSSRSYSPMPQICWRDGSQNCCVSKRQGSKKNLSRAFSRAVVLHIHGILRVSLKYPSAGDGRLWQKHHFWPQIKAGSRPLGGFEALLGNAI